MNEAYEIELQGLTATFMPNSFDLVIGAERIRLPDYDEWKIVYARVLIEDRWYFLPNDLYDEIDSLYSDRIGELLFALAIQ